MGLHQMGPPLDLVLALKKQLAIEHFIETGTFHGGTAEWASKHFGNVTTIELSEHYFQLAKAKFAAKPHVHPLFGSSPAALASLIPTLTQPALFWLDAHWSGLDTAGRAAECPLLDELTSINQSTLEHVILVDDARLFCAPPPRPHDPDQWPDLPDVTAALAGNRRRYVAIFQDTFIAVPHARRDLLAELLQTAKDHDAGHIGGWLQRLRR